MEIELYTHVDANFKSFCKIWWYIKPTIKNVKKINKCKCRYIVKFYSNEIINEVSVVWKINPCPLQNKDHKDLGF